MKKSQVWEQSSWQGRAVDLPVRCVQDDWPRMNGFPCAKGQKGSVSSSIHADVDFSELMYPIGSRDIFQLFFEAHVDRVLCNCHANYEEVIPSGRGDNESHWKNCSHPEHFGVSFTGHER